MLALISFAVMQVGPKSHLRRGAKLEMGREVDFRIRRGEFGAKSTKVRHYSAFRKGYRILTTTDMRQNSLLLPTIYLSVHLYIIRLRLLVEVLILTGCQFESSRDLLREARRCRLL